MFHAITDDGLLIAREFQDAAGFTKRERWFCESGTTNVGAGAGRGHHGTRGSGDRANRGGGRKPGGGMGSGGPRVDCRM